MGLFADTHVNSHLDALDHLRSHHRPAEVPDAGRNAAPHYASSVEGGSPVATRCSGVCVYPMRVLSLQHHRLVLVPLLPPGGMRSVRLTRPYLRCVYRYR